MAESPRVSTIIATHNRASLLPAALESALAQDVPDHEILVVDDASTDETAQVLARYPAVRYLRLPEGASGTPSRTRNAGLRAARGRFVAFLDDDDIWLPNRLAPALDLLENDPDLALVYGQAQPADSALQPFGSPFPALPLPEGHPVGAFLATVLHLNTVVVRRAALDAVGLFDETVYSAEDMDLTVRIARRFRCAALPRPLALVRFRELSSVPADGAAVHWWGRFQDDLGLLRHHLGVRDSRRPPFARGQRILLKRRGWYAAMLLRHARQAAQAASPEEARTAVRLAFRVSPLHCVKEPEFWRLLRAPAPAAGFSAESV